MYFQPSLWLQAGQTCRVALMYRKWLPCSGFHEKVPDQSILTGAGSCQQVCELLRGYFGGWNNIANNIKMKSCYIKIDNTMAFWSFGLPCAITATICACGFGWVTWCQNMRTTIAATSQTRTSWRIALLNANLQLMRSEVNPHSHSVMISILTSPFWNGYVLVHWLIQLLWLTHSIVKGHSRYISSKQIYKMKFAQDLWL